MVLGLWECRRFGGIKGSREMAGAVLERGGCWMVREGLSIVRVHLLC